MGNITGAYNDGGPGYLWGARDAYNNMDAYNDGGPGCLWGPRDAYNNIMMGGPGCLWGTWDAYGAYNDGGPGACYMGGCLLMAIHVRTQRMLLVVFVGSGITSSVKKAPLPYSCSKTWPSLLSVQSTASPRPTRGHPPGDRNTASQQHCNLCMYR